MAAKDSSYSAILTDEELLGERAILALGDHPGHDVAAAEIEDERF